MKRFSRLQLIFSLATVVLLALSILFGIFYFKEASKTGKLDDEIATLRNRINAVTTCDLNEKNMQLEACASKIVTDSSFPAQPYDNKEMTDAIIGVVADARVQLESLSHEGQGNLQLRTSTYTIDNYNLRCSVDEGKGSSLIVLLELFEELREEKYNTLLISNVDLPESRTEISFDIGILTQ